MAIDYEHLKRTYFQFDKPCPYRLRTKNEILIYPIMIEDYPMYETTKIIMEINKNETNDIKIIQMSYLEYLVDVIFAQSPDSSIYLGEFLRLILHEENITLDRDNGKICVAILDNVEDELYYKYIITSKELEEIAKLSFHQNDPNFDDTYYSPEIKQAMSDYYRLKYGNGNTPSFEKQRAYVTSQTGILNHEISKMTYRNFVLVFKSCVDSEMYITRNIIKASQKYEVKEEILHPLYVKDRDKLGEVFSKTDDYLREKVKPV